MTDDEQSQAQHQKVIDAVNLLRHEIDGSLLLSALVAQASVQAEMLIAAKMTDAAAVIDLFACACGSATATAPDTPMKTPRVVVVDGGDKGTKH
jgi:hypothetical protein